MVLPAAIGAASGSPPCVGARSITDPAGDEAQWPLSQEDPVLRYPALDFLEYRMTEFPDELEAVVTLNEAPPQDPAELYRYWIGFSFRLPDGAAHYMDARIQLTATYDSATVVGPNAYGNPYLQEVPVTWDGATIALRVHKAPIFEMAGTKNLTFGQPEASSDGPHASDRLQGPFLGGPYTQDFIFDGFDFKPLVPCSDDRVSDAVESHATVPSEGRPLPWLAAVGGAAASAFAFSIAAWIRRND